jgi:uncharacterized membrane protein
MSEMNPYQPPVPADGAANDGFDAAGRTLDGGRGWAWISEAFSLFMQTPGLWIVMFIIYLVCSLLLGLIPLLGGIANMLLYPVFGAGFMVVCRELDRGEPVEVGHLFAGFKENTTDLMVVGALAIAAFVALVVPAVLIVGGAGVFAGIKGNPGAFAAMGITIVLVALVVAAVSIPIYMALWFAAPLVMFHGMKPVAALKASFFGCLKNFIAFLLYGIVLLVLAVVATIPFGLGWLVLAPVLIASIYTAYRDIYCAA